jgi:hypothetical protein
VELTVVAMNTGTLSIRTKDSFASLEMTHVGLFMKQETTMEVSQCIE